MGSRLIIELAEVVTQGLPVVIQYYGYMDGDLIALATGRIDEDTLDEGTTIQREAVVTFPNHTQHFDLVVHAGNLSLETDFNCWNKERFMVLTNALQSCSVCYRVVS